MTLDELNYIKSYFTIQFSHGIWQPCGNPKCTTCEKEKKILEIVDREIALKIFDPNKND